MIKRSMGECQVDRENIDIYDKDLKTAQMICSSISDTNMRSKAVADVIGAKIAVEYFDTDSYQVDNSTSLHNIPSFVETYDIADIYINGAYIDVRVCFNKNELCVPKIHYDLNITPAVYMFVKLSPDLNQAEVMGFIRPESVNLNYTDGNVYFVTEDLLESIYDVESRFQTVLDVTDVEDKVFYDYLTENLSETDTINFIKDLEKSKNLRLKLQKAIKAQTIFNLVSTVSNLEINESEKQETEDVETNLDDLFEDNYEQEENTDIEDLSEYSTEITPSGADLIESLDKEESQQQEIQDYVESENEQQEELAENSLESLFTGEQEGVPVPAKKKGNPFVILLFSAILIGGIGYLLYTNYFNKNITESLPETIDTASQEVINDNAGNETENTENSVTKNNTEPMPVETVENISNVSNKEEASPISVPAIEQNIDASILVSNLKIDWEVPAGYASNTTAKRYFVKLGKIIQLNLKTELLLLHKPPLSNKITVELSYNPSKGKFDIVGIQQSSGEKSVDDVILQTVENALGMNLSTNSDSFANIQGNPILIIRL